MARDNRVHLLQLSTGKPHPGAQYPIIDGQTWSDCEIEIQGSILAILSREESFASYGHLQVWNWRTGASHPVSKLSTLSNIPRHTDPPY